MNYAYPLSDELRRHEAEGTWKKRGLVALFRDRVVSAPERTAIVDSSRRLSYRQLADEAVAVASSLRAIGLGRGDRVAVQLPNRWECAAVHLALEGSGIVALPLPPIYRSKELRFILSRTEAAAAVMIHGFRGFSYRDMFEELAPSLPSLRQIIALDADRPLPAGWMTWQELLAVGRDVATGPTLDELAESDPNALLEVAFTSGSTGDPKGVMHSSNTLLADHAGHIRAFELGPSDVVFTPSTLGHHIGFSMGMRVPLMIGATTVLMDTWDPVVAVELIARERCTFTCTTPTFLIDILGAPNLAAHHGLPSMTRWELAGAVVTSTLHEQVRAKMPRLGLGHCLGITEVGGLIIAPVDRPASKMLASGRAQPWIEIKVLGPDGQEVGPGVEGELVERGPTLLRGYYLKPDATAAAFTPDGFFRTGDQVRIDPDGWVWVTGRIKDLIKRGGENISPVEIEEIIACHPKVAEVAVLGMPDPRLGERVWAVVVLRDATDPLDFEEVTSWVSKAGLAKQKWPERLEIVDALPKTSIGKVHKQQLRGRLGA